MAQTVRSIRPYTDRVSEPEKIAPPRSEQKANIQRTPSDAKRPSAASGRKPQIAGIEHPPGAARIGRAAPAPCPSRTPAFHATRQRWRTLRLDSAVTSQDVMGFAWNPAPRRPRRRESLTPGRAPPDSAKKPSCRGRNRAGLGMDWGELASRARHVAATPIAACLCLNASGHRGVGGPVRTSPSLAPARPGRPLSPVLAAR
jgi:hypothetical protein